MTVIDLVGPKGYVHGWKYVGPPGPGGTVNSPKHGKGTVVSNDGGKLVVSYKSGRKSYDINPPKKGGKSGGKATSSGETAQERARRGADHAAAKQQPDRTAEGEQDKAASGAPVQQSAPNRQRLRDMSTDDLLERYDDFDSRRVGDPRGRKKAAVRNELERRGVFKDETRGDTSKPKLRRTKRGDPVLMDAPGTYQTGQRVQAVDDAGTTREYEVTGAGKEFTKAGQVQQYHYLRGTGNSGEPANQPEQPQAEQPSAESSTADKVLRGDTQPGDLSTGELRKVDAVLASRAAKLGKQGQLSPTHKAVKQELGARSAKEIKERQAQRRSDSAKKGAATRKSRQEQGLGRKTPKGMGEAPPGGWSDADRVTPGEGTSKHVVVPGSGGTRRDAEKEQADAVAKVKAEQDALTQDEDDVYGPARAAYINRTGDTDIVEGHRQGMVAVKQLRSLTPEEREVYDRAVAKSKTGGKGRLRISERHRAGMRAALDVRHGRPAKREAAAAKKAREEQISQENRDRRQANLGGGMYGHELEDRENKALQALSAAFTKHGEDSEQTARAKQTYESAVKARQDFYASPEKTGDVRTDLLAQVRHNVKLSADSLHKSNPDQGDVAATMDSPDMVLRRIKATDIAKSDRGMQSAIEVAQMAATDASEKKDFRAITAEPRSRMSAEDRTAAAERARAVADVLDAYGVGEQRGRRYIYSKDMHSKQGLPVSQWMRDYATNLEDDPAPSYTPTGNMSRLDSLTDSQLQVEKDAASSTWNQLRLQPDWNVDKADAKMRMRVFGDELRRRRQAAQKRLMQDLTQLSEDDLNAQLLEVGDDDQAIERILGEFERRSQASATTSPGQVDLTQLSEDDLSARLLESGDDESALDAIMAELDRRQNADPRAGMSKREREKADKMDQLISDGMGYMEAYSEAYGVSAEKMQRDDAIRRLREDGYTGRGYDELIRKAYRDELRRHMDDAEAATNGYMVTKAGRRRGIEPYDLWRSNEAFARKWATEELRGWWDQNVRLTLADYRQMHETGMGVGSRGGGQDWLR